MALESFNAYHSYLKAIEPLNDAERGRLFTACLQYSMTGEAPELRGNERFIFPSMAAQIDRDKESYAAKCRKNAENVSKRWSKNDRIPSHTDEYGGKSGIPNDTKRTKDKDKDKDKDNTVTPLTPQGETAAAPAGVEQVLACYRRAIGKPSPGIEDQAAQWLGVLSPELICMAIEAAVEHGKPSWAYVRGILRRCHESGIRTPEDYQAAERARQAKGNFPARSMKARSGEDQRPMKDMFHADWNAMLDDLDG